MDPFLRFYCEKIMVGLVLFTVVMIILIIADFLGLPLVF